MFPCEFYEIFKSTFFTEHLWAAASELKKRKLLLYLMILKSKQTKFVYENYVTCGKSHQTLEILNF